MVVVRLGMLPSPRYTSPRLLAGSASQVVSCQAASRCLVPLPTASASPPSGAALPLRPAGHGATSKAKPAVLIDGTTHGPLIIIAHRPVRNCSLTSDWPQRATVLGTLWSTFTRLLSRVSASML